MYRRLRPLLAMAAVVVFGFSVWFLTPRGQYLRGVVGGGDQFYSLDNRETWQLGTSEWPDYYCVVLDGEPTAAGGFEVFRELYRAPYRNTDLFCRPRHEKLF